jgi:hypothetical protein
MTRTVHGVIHGRAIELDTDLGIADGQRVEVQVTPAPSESPWGEGILRSAGVAADVPGFDEAFEQIQGERWIGGESNRSIRRPRGGF